MVGQNCSPINTQIAFSLRQADSGTPVGEIVRKMGVSEATFYAGRSMLAWAWSKCGGSSSLRRRTVS